MALVIDGSSPAASAGPGGTNTSDPFTPPPDPLLMCMWVGDGTGGSTNPSAISSSPSQTWATDVAAGYGQSDFLDNCWGAGQIYDAQPVGSTGSMTVAVVNDRTGYTSLMQVFVFTGHDPGAPIGVTGADAQISGTSITASYTASITGGQGFLVLSDWNAGSMAGATAGSGCTILYSGTLPGAISYLTLQRTAPDGVLGATTTMGVTGLTTGGQFRWAWVEIISVEARTGVHPPPGNRGPAAKHNAANW